MKELELNILRYFYQHKAAIDYLQFGVNEDLFLDPICKQLFHVYEAYVTKYKFPPDSNNLIVFLTENGVEDNIIDIFKKQFDVLYSGFQDISLVEEHLLKHVKKLAHTRALQKSLEKIDDNWTEKAVTELYKEISRIDQLDIHNRPKTSYLLRDLPSHNFTPPLVSPTCFKNFNSIIGMGGFFAPQLIVMMGGAKSMKTTLMLHLATGYAKDGHKVAYLDWENGQSQIGTVLQQILLCSRVEFLYADHNKMLLEQRVSEALKLGGDIVYTQLKAKRDNVLVADEYLDRDFDRTGRYPSAIFYDYLDITGADRNLKERREKIQMAYSDAKNLNQKCNAFGITISKMVSGSDKKDWHTEEDIGEDREKIFNADAVFSIHRTAEDAQEGVGYIQPIVQRVGESRTDVKIALDFDGTTRYIGDSVKQWTDR
jgi:hypothetical protein